MLGERGLWYKMNFFEHSARVPLIFSGPGVVKGATRNACSLVDILPTLLEVAGGGEDILGEPIDGRSLLPLARGEKDKKNEAIGEYCAEMTPYPVFMIRRDNFKYIHCDPDPPQMYNLDKDPLEKNNLAFDSNYSSHVETFSIEISKRWNSEKLRLDIINTQKSRRALHSAMEAGAGEHWDYDPPSDASQQYVRNHMDWTIAAKHYRFPPLRKK